VEVVTSAGFRPFVIEDGIVGFLYSKMDAVKTGDVLCVLKGTSRRVIIRLLEDDGSVFMFIGYCVVPEYRKWMYHEEFPTANARTTLTIV
jgi:hypothetical protein